MFIVRRKKGYVFPGKLEVTNTKKEEYNNEPIEYCSNCLSLSIIQEEEDFPAYCKDCNSCQFSECPIEVWEEKFYGRYLTNDINKVFSK